MWDMWDLATVNTDSKERVLNSRAVAILSSRLEWLGEDRCSGKRGHNNSGLFVHFPGMGSLAMVMEQKEVSMIITPSSL